VTIDPEEPLARATVEAIHVGDLEGLRRLLDEHPGLATARIGDDRPGGTTRSLLHVATDWPGHFPGGPATVAALVAAGAEVDARFGGGSHDETPLHWAASSDDVEVLDALLDAGADIEATGAVIAGGTPLTDARAFGQWRAAHRLVERGAQTTIDDAATLGLLDRLEGDFAGPGPAPEDLHPPSGGLPRRPARLRRVPAGPGRRPQLGPALGAADPAGRGRPQRRRRPGRLAAHQGGLPGRRATRPRPAGVASAAGTATSGGPAMAAFVPGVVTACLDAEIGRVDDLATGPADERETGPRPQPRR
jgi:uncharacterized protein